MKPDWLQHPDLASIDPNKLQILQTLAAQGSRKGQNEMLPFLMMAMSQTKKSGTSFSSEEIDLIIQVLKAQASPKEATAIEKLLTLLKNK